MSHHAPPARLPAPALCSVTLVPPTWPASCPAAACGETAVPSLSPAGCPAASCGVTCARSPGKPIARLRRGKPIARLRRVPRSAAGVGTQASPVNAGLLDPPGVSGFPLRRIPSSAVKDFYALHSTRHKAFPGLLQDSFVIHRTSRVYPPCTRYLHCFIHSSVHRSRGYQPAAVDRGRRSRLPAYDAGSYFTSHSLVGGSGDRHARGGQRQPGADR